ncbi:hypothetical protein CAC42_836 [Sphaceloma murrayae]|uniref:SGNH hydrolase-type esterase domain-containing protein n=1 Tax=Sphaceloma murrayae TaxID=2082308 RepID=A0A2K1QKD3_9PEZI|nr:hypothetical protein CAC42_836 [Sphaceloma murrayae]
MRVLTVGDSITQGAEGDHTWRYRLWQWLQSSEGLSTEDAVFVGPYMGTFPPPQPRPPQPPPYYGSTPALDPPRTGGGYAVGIDHTFVHSGHFAQWGRQAGEITGQIGDVVRKCEPDLVLVLMGFNDLAWGGADPSEVALRLRALIRESLQAKTDVRVVIGTVPMRTPIPGREELPAQTRLTNQYLRSAVWDLRRAGVLVSIASVDREYQCADGAYDGLHPNALGEWQIAMAFSQALVDLGIGTSPLDIPDDKEEYVVETPGNVVAEGAPMGVKVTWNPVYGSRGYDTRTRMTSQQEWSQGRVETNRMDITFTGSLVEWEIQVRASRGDDEYCKSAWCPSKITTSTRSGPPGPENVVVEPRPGGVAVSWLPPKGDWDIKRYEIAVWDQDTAGAFIRSWSFGTAGVAFIDCLDHGKRHDIWISTWANVNGEVIAGLPVQGPGFVSGCIVAESPSDSIDAPASMVDPRHATTIAGNSSELV